MLEIARQFLTTVRESAGEGDVLDEESVSDAEALLQVEITHGHNQSDQFVLTHVADRRPQ